MGSLATCINSCMWYTLRESWEAREGRIAELHLSYIQNVVQARVVHIHMRIKNIVHEGDAAVTSGNSFLMLLNRFMFLRILFSQSPQPLQAIRKAMPGVSQASCRPQRPCTCFLLHLCRAMSSCARQIDHTGGVSISCLTCLTSACHCKDLWVQDYGNYACMGLWLCQDQRASDFPIPCLPRILYTLTTMALQQRQLHTAISVMP